MAPHKWQNFVLQLQWTTQLLNFAELFHCMNLYWLMDLINK